MTRSQQDKEQAEISIQTELESTNVDDVHMQRVVESDGRTSVNSQVHVVTTSRQPVAMQ